MKIQGMSTQQAMAMQKSSQERRSEAPDVGNPRNIPPETVTGKAEQVGQTDGEAGGVVRLLEQNHFRGVADIRLRLNFQQQMTGVQQQQAVDNLEEESQALVSELGERVTLLGDDYGFGDQVDDLFAPFRETAARFFSGEQGNSFAGSSFFAEIRTTFTTMFDSLAMFNPFGGQGNELNSEVAGTDLAGTSVTPADEPEITPIEPVDSPEGRSEVGTENTAGDKTVVSPETDVESDEFSLALESLQQWFDSTVEAMENSFESFLGGMQPVSEPRGNGVAYSRFLAIYTAFGSNGVPESGEGDSSSGAIETSV